MKKSLLLLFLIMFMLIKGWAYDVSAPRGYAVFNNVTGTLTFTYGILDVPFLDGHDGLYETDCLWDSGWGDIISQIKKVEFTPGFVNANVWSTSNWFWGAESLTEVVGLEYLNTSNIENMSNMFKDCSGLINLDVSHLDTRNVQWMSSMFSGCSGLTTLDVSGFNTSNVTNMDGMFENCSGLTSLDVTHFDTSNVTNMGWMFNNCSGLTDIDVSHFVTDNVTSMRYMFRGCSGLTELDVTCFVTDNVTNMNSMFRGCSGLTNLDVTHFVTDNVTDMGSMFSGCRSLTSLDVSHFNTANVTDMGNMFQNCSTLTSLDLSNFDTSDVTKMDQMFLGCSNLTSLDLSYFNTEEVTTMMNTFCDCNALTNLDINNFNTCNVTSMYGMFNHCYALTNLDVSRFNTEKVTDMTLMFNECTALNTLDLSSFDTSNVVSMRDMFYDCHNLTTIYASEKWNTSKVTEGKYTFYNCLKLVGGRGTKYDILNVDYTYARIDGGNKKPGYFTKGDNRSGGIIVTIIKEDGEELKTVISINVTSEENKEVEITSVASASEESKNEVAIPAEITIGGETYKVTSIAANAFAGMTDVTDIYLPETDEPIKLGENALKIDDEHVANIHTSLAMLDNYALNAQLTQNVDAGKLMATVKAPNKYWTFSCGIDVEIPEEIKVYTCKISSNSEVKITEIDESLLTVDGKRIIKANNGVLVACPDNDEVNAYDIVAKPTQTTIATGDAKSYGEDNQLEPVIEAKNYSADEYYVLKDGEFHVIIANDSKVPACKAVLKKPATVAATRTLTIVGGDGTTGISRIVKVDDGSEWYNLRGQRIERPTTKGIYINNGKKVIIK